MSVFVERLENLLKGEQQPIGFGARQAVSPGQKIQVVACLSEESGDVSDIITGADAVLLCVSRADTASDLIQKITAASTDIPCGIWFRGSDKTETKQIAKLESDFLVFTAVGTPLTAIESYEGGKIVEVEPSMDAGLLYTVNTLPVDAVLAGGEEKEEDALTMQQLMAFQRFADIVTKPLLVPVPGKVTGKELLALWEAGISGVVVEADGQGRIKKLRQEIDKLDFPSQRRRDRSNVVLPQGGRGNTARID
jgi:hypothetical protein